MFSLWSLSKGRKKQEHFHYDCLKDSSKSLSLFLCWLVLLGRQKNKNKKKIAKKHNLCRDFKPFPALNKKCRKKSHIFISSFVYCVRMLEICETVLKNNNRKKKKKKKTKPDEKKDKTENGNNRKSSWFFWNVINNVLHTLFSSSSSSPSVLLLPLFSLFCNKNNTI